MTDLATSLSNLAAAKAANTDAVNKLTVAYQNATAGDADTIGKIDAVTSGLTSETQAILAALPPAQ